MRLAALAIGITIMMSTSHANAEPDAEAMVDALNGTFGRHAAMRASHAKGFCAAGTFTPTAAAGKLFATPVFKPGTYAANVRFSIAGGNPKVSDKAPAARGMGLEVKGPDGQHLVMAMISTPTFFAASRESFVAFLAARRPDPATGKPDPKKMEESNKSHIDSEAQRRWLAATPPSASYATAPYFATHTYSFATPDGTARPARWIFEPVSGRIGLTEEELASAPDSYLEDELRKRLTGGPAEWRVLLQIPQAIDPLLNPTVAWPDTRETIEVARLVIDRTVPAGSNESCDAFVYDPTLLPDGIIAPADPMFAVRAEAYAISSSRRAQ